MSPSAGTSALYRLAGHTIYIDPQMPALQPFLAQDQLFPTRHISTKLGKLTARSPSIKVEGWLGDQVSTVLLWRDKKDILLEIPRAGRFWIANEGSTIMRVSAPFITDNSFMEEALQGPPLVLALAMQGTWCLHASAIEYNHKTIAFLGESGTGKSTLAAYLAAQPDVLRVADDILPLTWEDHEVFAYPHFPQLKIPCDQQPGPGFPEKLPLAAVYILDEDPSISIEPFNPGRSALSLASLTVAARLFDRKLLSSHITFCSQVASNLPVHRLAYPRIWTELPNVWQALKNDLAALDV